MIKINALPLFRKVQFCILFSLIFTFSCSTNKPEQEVSDNENSMATPEYATDSILHFTSGIRSIFEDSKGNIWFGSVKEGVARYDGKLFTYFDDQSSLSHNQVRNIYEDQNGTIWFENSEGVSSFRLNTMITDPTRNYNFKEAWSLNETDLWFKADPQNGYNEREGQPGIYQFNGQSLFYRAFPIEQKPGEENYYTVTTPTIRSANGSVLWGTYGTVIGYDGVEFTMLDNEYFGLNEKTGFLHIRALFEDSKGNLWLGNNGIGPIKQNKDGFTILNQQFPMAFEGENSLFKVFSIGEDVDGNIWFGTSGSGVWKFESESLTHYSENEGLPSQHIWAIHRSKSGELWFAGENPSGVYVFDGSRFMKRF